MKRFLCMLLTAALFGCGGGSSSTAETTGAASEVPVNPVAGLVVACGDSNTEQPALPFADRWTTILSNLHPSLSIVNAGRQGSTSDYAVANINQVTILQPEKVLLMFGTNDAIMWNSETPKVSKEQFRQNLRLLVGKIRQRGGAPFLMTSLPVIEGSRQKYYYSRHPVEWYPGGARQWHESYNEIVREEAVALGTPLIDISAAFFAAAGANSDEALIASGLIDNSGTHLSAKGSQLVGITVSTFMQPSTTSPPEPSPAPEGAPTTDVMQQ